MRRRRWIVAGLAFFLFAGVVLVTVAILNRGPYAFLEKYHPRHVTINLGKLLSTLPGGSPKTPVPHTEMLVFDVADNGRVLKDMQRELVPAKGFVHIRHQDMTNIDKSETDWEFTKGAAPSGSFVPDDGVYYQYGYSAEFTRNELETGQLAMSYPTPLPHEKACIVILLREETWMEKQWAGIRSFLHL